jgi:EmrB/QacA subfamily drug resistance transporter
MNSQSKPVNANLLVVLLMITLFFNAFMGAAINIAIPKIAQDFSMNAIESSWVAMSFLLSSAMFLLPFGKLGDIYGRKKIFLYGNVVFAIATLACAFSYNTYMLIAFRFFQGIGGAMVMATGMALVTSVYPPQQRGKMLGMVVSAVYLGLTAAPVIGGILTQQLGWHSLFIVSVVASMIVITGLITKVKGEWAEPQFDTIDYKGSVIYMLSIFLLMYGFSKLPDLHAIIMSVTGFSGIIFFVLYEKRQEHPILNIKLFAQNRVFAFSNIAALINYAATFAITFILSLYLQYAKGLSPRDAGMILITQPAVMAITTSFAGRLSDRFNSGVLASIGMSVIVIGLIFLCNLDAHTSNFYLITNLVVVGFGFGTFSSPNTNSVMSSVEKRYLGIASASISTMRLLGQILSMAIATMVIHIFIGKAKLSSENVDLFLHSSKIIFIIFAVLCFFGVFASLARGKNQVMN